MCGPAALVWELAPGYK